MNEPTTTNGITERISVHDTEISALKQQISAIFAKIEHIETMIGNSQKTNWSVIISGLLLVGAVWAAAIHPMQADLDRHEKSAADLAQAVLAQNEHIIALRISEAIQDSAIQDLKKTQTAFDERGSPTLDKRLSVLETTLLYKKP